MNLCSIWVRYMNFWLCIAFLTPCVAFQGYVSSSIFTPRLNSDNILFSSKLDFTDFSKNIKLRKPLIRKSFHLNALKDASQAGLSDVFNDLSTRLYDAPYEATELNSSAEEFSFFDLDEVISDGPEGTKTSALRAELRKNHHVVLRLPAEDAQCIANMWRAARDFFQLDMTLKEIAGGGPFHKLDGVVGVVGFSRMEDGNEFLETRMGSDDRLMPPPAEADAVVPGFTVATTAARRVLTNLARAVVAAVSHDDSAGSGGWWGLAALVDDGECLLPGGWSSTQHRLCRYHPDSPVPFEAHTDATFLTLIPCSAVAGLEVHTAATGWLRPEEGASRAAAAAAAAAAGGGAAGAGEVAEAVELGRYVVVMAGEFLQVLTGGRYPAAVHRVARTGGAARLSAPLLVRGRAWVTVDPESLSEQPAVRARLEPLRGVTLGQLHRWLVQPPPPPPDDAPTGAGHPVAVAAT